MCSLCVVRLLLLRDGQCHLVTSRTQSVHPAFMAKRYVLQMKTQDILLCIANIDILNNFTFGMDVII